ncbi:hypothetical protein PDE_03902 [Penicillium oxalicum 114-2]|uniref:Uncharacterized protein n=1 Tax=Penicillium oxalicum (strain 114-2 / CGMCC 5302) TaxID=933388 RepID=S7ZJV3_PENO1|nr:hypothetical protein PDE_03902 [Penicillium oxalicum 114-2]
MTSLDNVKSDEFLNSRDSNHIKWTTFQSFQGLAGTAFIILAAKNQF